MFPNFHNHRALQQQGTSTTSQIKNLTPIPKAFTATNRRCPSNSRPCSIFFQPLRAVYKRELHLVYSMDLRRQTEFRLPRSCLLSSLLAYISHALLSFFYFLLSGSTDQHVYYDVSRKFHEMCSCEYIRLAYVWERRYPLLSTYSSRSTESLDLEFLCDFLNLFQYPGYLHHLKAWAQYTCFQRCILPSGVSILCCIRP